MSTPFNFIFEMQPFFFEIGDMRIFADSMSGMLNRVNVAIELMMLFFQMQNVSFYFISVHGFS